MTIFLTDKRIRHRWTDKQTDRQMSEQTNRQTDRQTVLRTELLYQFCKHPWIRLYQTPVTSLRHFSETSINQYTGRSIDQSYSYIHWFIHDCSFIRLHQWDHKGTGQLYQEFNSWENCFYTQNFRGNIIKYYFYLRTRHEVVHKDVHESVH